MRPRRLHDKDSLQKMPGLAVPILNMSSAVVAALNAASLSQDFTAVSKYVPKFDLSSTSTVQVQVVPKSDAREMETAATDAADIVIDIGVYKKLSGTIANEDTEIAGMLSLCEEIKTVFNRKRLGTVDYAVCVKMDHNPIYSVENIDESRAFLSVITTYWRGSLELLQHYIHVAG